MVHFVRPLLAGGVIGVDSFPIRLAFVPAIAAYRDHDGGGIRAGSDLTVSASACAGLATVRMPSLSESLIRR